MMGTLTKRQRNCLAWFRVHEPRQTMGGLKATWTFDVRTLDSLVRRGLLVFAPGAFGGERINGVYRLSDEAAS